MAAATQSCLGPLERGLPWPLLERANESQRVVLPGMEEPDNPAAPFWPHLYGEYTDLLMDQGPVV